MSQGRASLGQDVHYLVEGVLRGTLATGLLRPFTPPQVREGEDYPATAPLDSGEPA